MDSQSNQRSHGQVPVRFQILARALARGVTEGEFLGAYKEVLAQVESEDRNLSPNMRQSSIEHRVWTRFFSQEPFPQPLELPVANGFIDLPASEVADHLNVDQNQGSSEGQGQQSKSTSGPTYVAKVSRLGDNNPGNDQNQGGSKAYQPGSAVDVGKLTSTPGPSGCKVGFPFTVAEMFVGGEYIPKMDSPDRPAYDRAWELERARREEEAMHNQEKKM